ncbi:MAG: MFS transporter [Jatrophihabitans sp.]|uniref:MFS transporter n=1 Tax=Jatrophihabitans sp. TaxID=1932789 RepID=UPI003F7F1A68
MTIERVRDEATAPPSIFGPQHRATTAGLLTVIAMLAFEAMAVGPALPSAVRDLHALGGYGLLFTTPLATSVVGMVVSGRLSDARGPRQPLLFGIVAFLAGLLVAGTAGTMTQLVLARAVQGVGVGLTITAAYVVIGERYDDELRPRVFAATSSAWVLPSLLGPVASGLLTEHVGWRWVFLGLVPFVLVGTALLWPVLEAMHRPPVASARDGRRLVRATAVAVGVSAVEAAGQHGWSPVLVLVVPGLALLAWGVVALVPPGTFRAAQGVAAAVTMRGLAAGAFFGVEATVPLMLQVQHGYGPLLAGVPLTMAGLTWALGSWWHGRIPGDADARRSHLAQLGFVCIGVAGVVIAVVSQRAIDPWPVYVTWAVAGAGAGMVMPAASVLLLRHTTDADRGAHSASLQLADTTTGALSTGFAGVLIAAAAAGSVSYGAAFAVSDAVMAAIAVVGVAAASRAAG